jgi:hypothetical protein
MGIAARSAVVIAGIVVSWTAAAGTAAAQPSRTSGSAQARPAGGETTTVSRNSPVVWVITTDGQERKGRLVSFTPERVVVRVGDADQTIGMADLLRVDTADSISNGIRNGAISGAVLGGLGFAAIASSCDDCGDGMAVAGVFITGFYALTGAGLGALIDHAIEGRQSIFTKTAAPRVAVAPLIAPRRGGLQLRFVW